MLDYTLLLDIIGTIAFALSGYILASKAGYDFLGIIVITFTTAFGGGVVRDLLTNRTPFIFQENYPISVVFIVMVFAFIFKLHKQTTLTDNLIFNLSDSIGLSIFALTGAVIGLDSGFNLGGILFLSFFTAVGGGMLRDTMMNKTPFVLTNDFYGTIAILIGFLIWFANEFLLLNDISKTVILAFGITMRLVAVKYNWKLPKLI